MITLLSIAVSALDPVRAVITLLCLWLLRGPWGILIAVVASALAVESMLTATQFTRTWGEGFHIGLAASIIQAVLIYWPLSAMRRRKVIKEGLAAK